MPRPDIDEDSQARAEWGLRCYVQQIAIGLGIGLESACCEAILPASAYLALTQRLVSAPDRDVALYWDATHGWAVGMESGAGGAPVLVAYLGGADVLPDSESVVLFAKTVLADQPAGQPNPPVHLPDEGLTGRLAGCVPTLTP